MPPLVSVITPLYNYEQYIATAIESVLQQTYPHIEMIVVDDGSTDHGPEVVESYRDQGVKLIRQPRNGYGVARALNLAIENACGEYISWLSADDYFLPHKIQTNLEVFEAQKKIQPALGLVHSRPGVESADLSYLKKYCPLSEEEQNLQLQQFGKVCWSFDKELGNDHDILFFSLFCNHINGCTTFIPKSVFEQIGGFKNSWAVTQDYNMWMRILLAGYEVFYIPEVLSASRFHPVNTGFYSDGFIAAEASLVMQFTREQLPAHRLDQLILSSQLKQEKIISFSERYAEIMIAQGLYAQALWELMDKDALFNPGFSHGRQDLTDRVNPFVLPPLQQDTTLTWGITLTEQALKAPRLFAIMTEFCAAFCAEDEVCLLFWIEANLQPTWPTLLAQWKTQICMYLNRPETELPQIRWTAEPMIEALAAIQMYIPIGNPESLEQRCIFSLRSQGRIIQWTAERDELKTMYCYYHGLTQWNQPFQEKSFRQLLHTPATSLFYHALPETTAIFYQKTWWMLDTHHAFLRSLTRHTEDSTTRRKTWQWSALPLPAHLYLPDWQEKNSDPLIFEDASGKIILCLYSPDNQTHWQESLQAFLNTGLNHPDFSLVIVAQASEAQQEDVQEDIMLILTGSAYDPENIENISITCFEHPDWSAIFQACWLWIHPVATPENWAPLWPALLCSEMGLITLDWMSEPFRENCWLSTDHSVAALSTVLQQALEAPELTAARARAFHAQARYPAEREQGFKEIFTKVISP